MKIDDNLLLNKVLKTNLHKVKNGVFGMSFAEKYKTQKTYSEFVDFAKKSGLDQEEENSEKSFWEFVRNPKCSKVPLYAIDNDMTLFPETCSTWNLSQIKAEESVIHQLDVDLPGVLKPYTYFGMRNTCFAWHVEDSNLLSINICWMGMKTWYFIPTDNEKDFESLAATETKHDDSCSFHLRHKSLFIPPSKLKQHGIPFGRVSV